MATISIADNDARIQHTIGSGGNTANSTQFTIDFPFFSLDDINVIITNSSGVDTTLTRGTGSNTFAVTGTAVDDGFSGGNITLGSVYTSSTVTIFRDIAVARTSDFATSGPFNISSLNTDLDKVYAIMQEIENKNSRALTMAESDDASEISLPNKATRKGNVLAFNATTGAAEAGPSIGSVTTVSAQSTNINTVAGISANITTVAGISSNVTTVAGISGNVTTVAGITSNISSVVSNASNINSVAGSISNVNTVAGSISNVNSVASNASNINTVAGKASLITSDFAADMALVDSTFVSKMNLVTSDFVTDMSVVTADFISDLNDLATTTIIQDLDLLATTDFINDLNAVEGIKANVTSVANNSTNINSVASNSTNINSVAGSITNVNNVGGAIANVNTVATNLSGVNSFAERYRVQAGVPGADNDLGDLVFDTTANTLKVFGSSGFQNAGSSVNGTSERFTYNITGTPTTLTGASGTGFAEAGSKTLAYDAGFIDVYLNGVKMVNGTDVTVTSGNSVVFASALSSGDVVDIVTFGTFQVATLNASNLASGTVPVARVSGSYTSITGTGALDAGSITSGFGNINNGTSTLTTGNTDINGTLSISGHTTLESGSDLITATAGTSNLRIGANAGDAILSGGEKNVFVGDEAGTSITTADKNVAIGFEALKTDTLGTASVAIGHGALSTQNFTSAAQTFNVAIGFDSGKSITTGTANTLIGNETGDALTTGNTNTALGNRALSTDTKGDRAVAIGSGALQNQNFSSTTDNYNIGIGNLAGNAITTGIYNTFIGGLAGDAQTVADNNTAVGFEALSTNTNGSGSVAIGFRALKTQNYGSATDSLNVAVGNATGTAVTTGTKNTLIGHAAGENQTDAGNNTFIGHKAGNAETRGHNSVAVGSNALLVQSTNSNTSIDNTAVGYNAGKSCVAGTDNTFIGEGSGESTTSSKNTFVGGISGKLKTSGSGNTLIGRFSGNGGGGSLDIRTNTDNVAISDGEGVVRFYSDENTYSVMGKAGQNMFLVQSSRIAGSTLTGGTVDNEMSNGASNRRWTEVFAVSNSINTSDENEKQDIEALSEKEKKVAVSCKGLIKKYRWKDAVAKKGDDARIHVGVIAQELKSAFEAEGLDASRYGMFCSDTWWEIDEIKDGVTTTRDYDTEDKAPKGAVKKTRLGVRYAELLAFIISAM